MTERVPFKDKPDVDLSKPVIDKLPIDGNCFGNMWDPTTKECSNCGMSDLCCLIFRKNTLNNKVKRITNQKGPFLDVTHFDINKEKLAEILSEEEVPYSELFTIVNKKTGCKDANMINIWIDIFFKEYKFINKNGIICKES